MKNTVNLFQMTVTAAIAGVLTIAYVAAEEKAEEQPEEDVREKIVKALEEQEKTIMTATEVSPETEKKTDEVDLAETKEQKDKEPSPRDLALKDHREQLKIYDLDLNGNISEEEWKAANEKNPDRNEKFFLVDKDKDGEIDNDEAVKFLMQRISLESTFVGESDDNGTEAIIEDGIEDNAPSELRFTLFSIPLGD